MKTIQKIISLVHAIKNKNTVMEGTITASLWILFAHHAAEKARLSTILFYRVRSLSGLLMIRFEKSALSFLWHAYYLRSFRSAVVAQCDLNGHG